MLMITATLRSTIGSSLTEQNRNALFSAYDLEALVLACARIQLDMYLAPLGDKDVQRRVASSLIEPFSTLVHNALSGGEMIASPQSILGAAKWAIQQASGTKADDAGAMSAAVMLALDYAVVLEDVMAVDLRGDRWGGIASGIAMAAIQAQVFSAAPHISSAIARWHGERRIAASMYPDENDRFNSEFLAATGCTHSTLSTVGLYLLFDLSHQKVVLVSPAHFVNSLLDANEVAAALNLISADAQTISTEIAKEETTFAPAWAYNSLRRYPMLRRGDGDLCLLSPNFLYERVCGTAYFLEIHDALSGNQRDGSFGSFMGHLAEEYAAELVERIMEHQPSPGGRMLRDSEIGELWPEERHCDFLLDCGTSWVAADVVRHPITARATVAGDMDALNKNLDTVIYSKAEQIDNVIRHLIETRGALPGETHGGAPLEYFPLIIATEGFPWNEFTAKEINAGLKKRGLLQHRLIRPLTVTSMEELGIIEAFTTDGKGSIDKILSGRFTKGYGSIPLSHYLSAMGGGRISAEVAKEANAGIRELAVAFGVEDQYNELPDT